MKRIFLLVLLLCLVLSGCASFQPKTEEGKLSIVTSLFPQYDFARVIAGDLAEVTLLLPPGAESHSYEPTPADLIKINQADLFVYTGDNLEAWAKTLLEGLEGDPAILDISQGIELHEHEGHDHGAQDPHIFTNPKYAMKMAQSLTDKLCEIDPMHEGDYRSRAAAYQEELKQLDADFRQTVKEAKRQKLVFGGRFAFLYFVEEYGLSFEAAYDSCSSESEPSAARLAEIMEIVKREQIPVVFYEELSNHKTADLICAETGAKSLLLHSCHNVSKEDLTNGASYLSLMKMNLEHLKEALS